jgi:hypothetical protein
MLLMKKRRDVMLNPSIEKEIISQLSKLPIEKQQQVLHFVRALTTIKPLGVPGKDLLCFAGTIEPGDLQVMAQVIEEDCEKVNLDEW